MEELSDCTICLEKIKITEVVTTRCGHWFCKECFWKWTKQNNKCPNCREELIERDRSEELSMMRILDRRREIVAENEELRDESRELKRRLKTQRVNIRRKRKILDELDDEILGNEKIMNEIEMWKKNPKLAKKMLEERLEKIGKERERQQRRNKLFMIKQFHMRIGGMTRKKICEYHYNRPHPGDRMYGAVLIFKWDYHGCKEKGWDFRNIIDMMYPKKRMIKLGRRRYMNAKEFYKRMFNMPIERNILGNMLKNDPADETEDLTNRLRISDLSIEERVIERECPYEEDIRDDYDEEMLPATAYGDEEAELPSTSELVVTGTRAIPMLVNMNQRVITRIGDFSLEEFDRAASGLMDGLRIDSNGNISYHGYFYEGRPVTEEEFNRLESRDIEDGINNYELADEEIV